MRLLIQRKAIYEQRYEYIDRETKEKVSKIVRYNDAKKETSDKQILNLVFQSVYKVEGESEEQFKQRREEVNRYNLAKHEMLYTVNFAKSEGLLFNYFSGKFGE